MYKISGAAARQMRPGTMPARAQAPHEIGCPRASEAKLTARGLAAMAVMNIAEEMQLVWKHVFMTYAPIFFSVPWAGSLPQARHRALARGKKMPPAIQAVLPALRKEELCCCLLN